MEQLPSDASRPVLKCLDDWEDDLRVRYPETSRDSKALDGFRDYASTTQLHVREFYRLHHLHQTVEFVRAKRADFLRRNRRMLGLWDGLEFLNTLVDDSDPDTRLPQIEHLLQTAEAIRRDGHPRWFVLVGLVHDFGKVLCLFGEPQWAVVGDTYPVGCAFSDKIVWSKYLEANPDMMVATYQTRLGIYEEGCGLDKVLLSWGHDEYMYHVTKEYLPVEAQYMIRYHSFYPWHREGEYSYLTNAQDRESLSAVQRFNQYDLYTKSAERTDPEALRSYYDELWHEFFPPQLAF